MKIVPLISVVGILILSCYSQLKAQDLTAAISKVELSQLVDSLKRLMTHHYVFPEKGEQMATFIDRRWREGFYDEWVDPRTLAEKLTEDLQSVSNDLHIRVRWNPEMVSEMTMSQSQEDSLHLIEIWDKRAARNNFGFKEIRMLSEGVGYVKLNEFSGSPKAGNVAAAAMNFLAGSEAVIVDLRENGGGSPDMIQFLTTYFYERELVHLNNFYHRSTDEITQRWTLPFVPGERLAGTDLYILTSGRTFSAAEEFTYNLKNLQRATVVGETTGGGAHPGGMMPASSGFLVFVPSGRAINPITGTNWEGVGVEPHVEVPAEQALDEAHYLAVENLSKKYNGEENPYLWTREFLQTLARPLKIDAKELEEYEGKYGARSIQLREGHLVYQRDDGPLYPLQIMKKDLFMIRDLPYFRLKFIRENDRIVAVEGLYQNGHRDKNEKNAGP